MHTACRRRARAASVVHPRPRCGHALRAGAAGRPHTTKVKLVRDRSQDNRDIYDRLLRYVEKGGRDIGRKQVGRGWAKVYVFDTPFARVGTYRRARNSARSHDRGVWNACGGHFHQGT